MFLVDTHCHLNFHPLSARLDPVLNRARERRVGAVVVPAYDPASWQPIAELARHSLVHAAFGVHPWVADQPHSLASLGRLIEASGGVAVGEIGLDTKVDVPYDVQRRVFESQLRFASEFELPVSLHIRGAFEEMLAILKRCRPRPTGVVHAFSRGPELAARFLDLGLHIAFGGTITQPAAGHCRSAARSVPLERVVLETDAPSIGLYGVPPVEVEPAHVADVAAALAEIRGESIETIAEVTTKNAVRLFKLPPPVQTFADD